MGWGGGVLNIPLQSNLADLKYFSGKMSPGGNFFSPSFKGRFTCTSALPELKHTATVFSGVKGAPDYQHYPITQAHLGTSGVKPNKTVNLYSVVLFPQKLSGFLDLTRLVVFLLPPLRYSRFMNAEFSLRPHIIFYCVTDSREFEISFLSRSFNKCG